MSNVPRGKKQCFVVTAPREMIAFVRVVESMSVQNVTQKKKSLMMLARNVVASIATIGNCQGEGEFLMECDICHLKSANPVSKRMYSTGLRETRKISFVRRVHKRISSKTSSY